MLKFTLKKEWLNFMKGWVTLESMLYEAFHKGADLLLWLLEGEEDAIDKIIEGIGFKSEDENIV